MSNSVKCKANEVYWGNRVENLKEALSFAEESLQKSCTHEGIMSGVCPICDQDIEVPCYFTQDCKGFILKSLRSENFCPECWSAAGFSCE